MRLKKAARFLVMAGMASLLAGSAWGDEADGDPEQLLTAPAGLVLVPSEDVGQLQADSEPSEEDGGGAPEPSAQDGEGQGSTASAWEASGADTQDGGGQDLAGTPDDPDPDSGLEDTVENGGSEARQDNGPSGPDGPEEAEGSTEPAEDERPVQPEEPQTVGPATPQGILLSQSTVALGDSVCVTPQFSEGNTEGYIFNYVWMYDDWAQWDSSIQDSGLETDPTHEFTLEAGTTPCTSTS